MRLNQPNPSRPAWYDRNPISIANAYGSSGDAPAGDTVRWTYTVPAGRKFAVQFLECQLIRATAAAPAAFAQTYMQITPSGGSAKSVMLTVLYSNTVDAGRSLVGAGNLMLNSGDLINGHTFDGSTGGTLAPFVLAEGMEFDA